MLVPSGLLPRAVNTAVLRARSRYLPQGKSLAMNGPIDITRLDSRHGLP